MAKSGLRTLLLALTLLLSACGGGGGSTSGGGTSASGYTVGGTLDGLTSGTSVTLYNKQTGESLSLGANGGFAFTTTQASGANYAVTVSTPPTGLSCSVTDGLGVVGSANVTSIVVACTTPYTVSASVSGLTASQTVKLIDNSIDVLQVSSNVTAAFARKLANGQAYDVAVAAQPVGAVCEVGANAVGTISGANVTVPVSCSASPNNEYLYVATPNGTVGVSGYPISLGNGTLGTQIGPVTTHNYPVALAAYTDTSGPYSYLYTIGGNSGADDVTGLSINSGGAIALVGTPAQTGIGSDPYGVTVSPNGNYVYVANNNDNDIAIFRSNAGALTLSTTVPSGGINPQALVFNPAGTFLYVLNAGSNTVTTFAANASTGALTQIGSPVATGVTPYGVQTSVTPGGTFLYVANYGSNSVSAYSLGSNGLPSPITGSPFAAGAHPFAVTVNPAGTFAYVANETDNTVSTYSIDPTYGTLTPVGSPTPTGTGSNPVGVVVDPSGQYLYVSAYTPGPSNGAIELFKIDQGTGALTLASLTAATPPGNPRSLVAVRR
jgi:6-phosphogluconolactonase (cycloisomerase 2 family)